MKLAMPPLPQDPNEEIAALIETLHRTEQRLEELTAGEVDAVADREGRTFVLRHAQEQLRHSEAAWQAAILNALPANIAVLDSRGTITSVNAVWRNFGRANASHGPGHGVGTNYLEVCDSACGDDAAEAHQAAAGIRSVLVAAAKTYALEYACNSPTQRRWFLMTATPLVDGQGHGAVVMHLDITERKLAEESLRESEQKLSAICDGVLDGILVADPESRMFLSANAAICRMLGYTVEEMLRLGVRDIHPQQDLPHVTAQFERVMRHDGEFARNIPMLRKDGSVFYADVKSAHIRFAEKDYLMCVFSDVTQRKAAEAEIEYKNTMLQTQQENSLDAILIVDSNDHIVSFNQQFIALWQLPPQLVSVGPDAPVLQAVAAQVENPEAFVAGVKYLYAHRDDKSHDEVHLKDQRIVDQYSAPILGEAGRYYGRVWYFRDITERRRSEQALRESERRFSDLLENVELIAVMLDRDGRTTYCNDFLLQLTGWQREEVIGRNWFDVFVPPEIVGMKDKFFTALFANAPAALHHENEILTRSGGRRLIRWNNTVLRSTGGDVVGTASIGEDITEQKRAEQALLELRRMSELILDSVEEGIYGIDRDGKISFQNAAAANLLGYGPDELLGKGAHAALHHSRADGTPYPRAQCPTILTLADGLVRRVAGEVFWRRDGASLSVDYTTAPIRDEQDVIVGEVVTFRDVSARRQAELDLRESERSTTASRADAAAVRDIAARLQAILDTVADGIITIDENGMVETLNPATERIFGHAAAALVGQNIRMLMPEPYHSQHDGYLARYRATGEAHIIGTGREVTGLRKDGSIFPLDLSVSEMTLGGTRHFTGVVRDITERQAAAQTLRTARIEAERANAAKDIFLATMSHEIRTPMNGVIGMIGVLQQSSLNSSQMEMTQIIHDSAFALLAVINDILDYSKIEAGKFQIESVPMSVADVVESVCDLLERIAVKKEVALTLFTDPAIPAEVLGDPGRLRQILINLASNAIKFSSGNERTGRVSVRVLLVRKDTEGGMLEFQIADNGIGIDAASLDRLFTPFNQADSTTTRKYGGTGLGLAISRQLANMMDGDISVNSAPGKGSLFSVRIPFALPAAADVAERIRSIAAEPDPQWVAGLSCLVAGFADDIGGDLAAYLAHGAATVEQATDMAAARQWIVGRTLGRSIVVIDARAGSAALEQLRVTAGDHPDSDVRFVVVRPGLRRGLQVENGHLVSVRGNVLTRRMLLHAVAIAAGRASAPAQDALPDAGRVLSSETQRRRGSRILVAEDNEINQRVILHQLALLGYVADIAGDGQEALARWSLDHHALLLTDLHMPRMDGYALTAAIRRDEGKGEHLPIIALTANALKSEEDHCRAAGMDDYLTKPVLLDRLRAMLERWLPVSGANETAADGATPPPGEPLAVLDRTLLPKLIGNEPALLAQFFKDFRHSAQMTGGEIRAAIALGDWKAAGDGAHKLKSSSRAMGALALGDVCARLEQAGKNADGSTAGVLAAEFEHSLAITLVAIDQKED